MFKSDYGRLYHEEQVKDYLRESQPPGIEHLPRPPRSKRVRYSAILLLSVVALLGVGFFMLAVKS